MTITIRSVHPRFSAEVDGFGLARIEGISCPAKRDLSKQYTLPQDEYVFSHTWNVGDVLLWDQRAVLHRATPWNYDEPRKLTSLCVTALSSDGLDSMRMGEFSAPEHGLRRDR